jgi:hypothetical protein
MDQDYILPVNLKNVLGNESRDFTVKASRVQPLKLSLGVLAFGIVWFLFSSIFVFVFLGPLFLGQEVHFEADGVPTTAGPGNLGPIIAPALIISVFVLVGIAMITWGIVLLTKKGGWFVGTPTRLVYYQGGDIRSIDWEQFSGDIEISGNDKKGNLTLQMRSGRMVSQKNGPDRYVPDTIYIAGIPEVFKVEKLCRGRIKENDPTPVISSGETQMPLDHAIEQIAEKPTEESGNLNVF